MDFDDCEDVKPLSLSDLLNGSLECRRREPVTFPNNVLRLQYKEDDPILPSKLFEIAKILKGHIDSVPISSQRTIQFIKEIHQNLIFLHECVSQNAKAKQFLLSQDLHVLLIRYVELEYEVLYYGYGNYSPEYESLVEKRILTLLLVMLQNSKTEKDRYITNMMDVCVANTLYIVKSINPEYKKENPLIENIMRKLLQKLNILKTVDKVKKKNEVLTMEKLLKEPRLQNVHKHLQKRDYSFKIELNTADEDEELEFINLDETNEQDENEVSLKEEIKREPQDDKKFFIPSLFYNNREKQSTIIDLSDEADQMYSQPSHKKRHKIRNKKHHRNRYKDNYNVTSDKCIIGNRLKHLSTSTSICDTIKRNLLNSENSDSNSSVVIVEDDADQDLEVIRISTPSPIISSTGTSLTDNAYLSDTQFSETSLGTASMHQNTPSSFMAMSPETNQSSISSDNNEKNTTMFPKSSESDETASRRLNSDFDDIFLDCEDVSDNELDFSDDIEFHLNTETNNGNDDSGVYAEETPLNVIRTECAEVQPVADAKKIIENESTLVAASETQSEISATESVPEQPIEASEKLNNDTYAIETVITDEGTVAELTKDRVEYDGKSIETNEITRHDAESTEIAGRSVENEESVKTVDNTEIAVNNQESISTGDYTELTAATKDNTENIVRCTEIIRGDVESIACVTVNTDDAECVTPNSDGVESTIVNAESAECTADDTSGTEYITSDAEGTNCIAADANSTECITANSDDAECTSTNTDNAECTTAEINCTECVTTNTDGAESIINTGGIESTTSNTDGTDSVATNTDNVESAIPDIDRIEFMTTSTGNAECTTAEIDCTECVITNTDGVECTITNTDNAECTTADTDCTESTTNIDNVECTTAEIDCTECVTINTDGVECTITDTDNTECTTTNRDNAEGTTADTDCTESITTNIDNVDCATATDCTESVTTNTDGVECTITDTDNAECTTAGTNCTESITTNTDNVECTTAETYCTESVTTNTDGAECTITKTDNTECTTADTDRTESITSNTDNPEPTTNTDSTECGKINTENDKIIKDDTEITESVKNNTEVAAYSTKSIINTERTAHSVENVEDVVEHTICSTRTTEHKTESSELAADNTERDSENLDHSLTDIANVKHCAENTKHNIETTENQENVQHDVEDLKSDSDVEAKQNCVLETENCPTEIEIPTEITDFDCIVEEVEVTTTETIVEKAPDDHDNINLRDRPENESVDLCINQNEPDFINSIEIGSTEEIVTDTNTNTVNEPEVSNKTDESTKTYETSSKFNTQEEVPDKTEKDKACSNDDFEEFNRTHNLDVLAFVASEQQKMENRHRQLKKNKTAKRARKKSDSGKKETTKEEEEEVVEKRVTRSCSMKSKLNVTQAVLNIPQVQDNLQCLPSTFMDLGNLVTPPPICVYNMISDNPTDNDESNDAPYLQTQETIRPSVFDEDTIEDGFVLRTSKEDDDSNKEIIISIPEDNENFPGIDFDLLKDTEKFIRSTRKSRNSFTNILKRKSITEKKVNPKNKITSVESSGEESLNKSSASSAETSEDGALNKNKSRLVPVKKRKNYGKTEVELNAQTEATEENILLKSPLRNSNQLNTKENKSPSIITTISKRLQDSFSDDATKENKSDSKKQNKPDKTAPVLEKERRNSQDDSSPEMPLLERQVPEVTNSQEAVPEVEAVIEETITTTPTSRRLSQNNRRVLTKAALKSFQQLNENNTKTKKSPGKIKNAKERSKSEDFTNIKKRGRRSTRALSEKDKPEPITVKCVIENTKTLRGRKITSIFNEVEVREDFTIDESTSEEDIPLKQIKAKLRQAKIKVNKEKLKPIEELPLFAIEDNIKITYNTKKTKRDVPVKPKVVGKNDMKAVKENEKNEEKDKSISENVQLSTAPKSKKSKASLEKEPVESKQDEDEVGKIIDAVEEEKPKKKQRKKRTVVSVVNPPESATNTKINEKDESKKLKPAAAVKEDDVKEESVKIVQNKSTASKRKSTAAPNRTAKRMKLNTKEDIVIKENEIVNSKNVQSAATDLIKINNQHETLPQNENSTATDTIMTRHEVGSIVTEQKNSSDGGDSKNKESDKEVSTEDAGVDAVTNKRDENVALIDKSACKNDNNGREKTVEVEQEKIVGGEEKKMCDGEQAKVVNVEQEKMVVVEQEKMVVVEQEKSVDVSQKKLVDVSQKKVVDVGQKKLVDVGQKKLVDVSQKKLVDVGQKKSVDVSQKKLVDVSQKKLVDVGQKKLVDAEQEKMLDVEQEKLIGVDQEKMVAMEQEKLIDQQEKLVDTEQKKLVDAQQKKMVGAKQKKMVNGKQDTIDEKQKNSVETDRKKSNEPEQEKIAEAKENFEVRQEKVIQEESIKLMEQENTREKKEENFVDVQQSNINEIKQDIVNENEHNKIEETKQDASKENDDDAVKETEDLIKEKDVDVTREKDVDVTREKVDGTIREKQDDIMVEKEQETIKQKGQDVVKEKYQDLIKENDNGVIKQNDQDVIKEKQKEVTKEDQGVIEENQKNVMRENVPSVIPDKEQGVIKEKKRNIINNTQQSIIKERKQNVIKERKPTVVRERKPIVIKERKPIVIKERKQNIVKGRQQKMKEQKQNAAKERKQNVIKRRQQNVIKEKEQDMLEENNKNLLKENNRDIVAEEERNTLKENGLQDQIKEVSPEIVTEKEQDATTGNKKINIEETNHKITPEPEITIEPVQRDKTEQETTPETKQEVKNTIQNEKQQTEIQTTTSDDSVTCTKTISSEEDSSKLEVDAVEAVPLSKNKEANISSEVEKLNNPVTVPQSNPTEEDEIPPTTRESRESESSSKTLRQSVTVKEPTCINSGKQNETKCIFDGQNLLIITEIDEETANHASSGDPVANSHLEEVADDVETLGKEDAPNVDEEPKSVPEDKREIIAEVTEKHNPELTEIVPEKETEILRKNSAPMSDAKDVSVSNTETEASNPTLNQNLDEVTEVNIRTKRFKVMTELSERQPASVTKTDSHQAKKSAECNEEQHFTFFASPKRERKQSKILKRKSPKRIETIIENLRRKSSLQSQSDDKETTVANESESPAESSAVESVAKVPMVVEVAPMPVVPKAVPIPVAVSVPLELPETEISAVEESDESAAESIFEKENTSSSEDLTPQSQEQSDDNSSRSSNSTQSSSRSFISDVNENKLAHQQIFPEETLSSPPHKETENEQPLFDPTQKFPLELGICEMEVDSNINVHEEIVTDEPLIVEENSPIAIECQEENTCESQLESVSSHSADFSFKGSDGNSNSADSDSSKSLPVTESAAQKVVDDFINEATAGVLNTSESLIVDTTSLECIQNSLKEIPATAIERTENTVNVSRVEKQKEKIFGPGGNSKKTIPPTGNPCESTSDNLLNIISKSPYNTFIFVQGSEHDYHSLTIESDPLLGGADEADMNESGNSSTTIKQAAPELGDDILPYIPTLSENNLNQEPSSSLNESSVDSSTDFQLQLEQCLIGNSLVGQETSPTALTQINCDNLYQTNLKQVVLEYENANKTANEQVYVNQTNIDNEFMDVLTNIQKLNNMAKSTPRQDPTNANTNFQNVMLDANAQATSNSQNYEIGFNFVQAPEYLSNSSTSNIENSIINDLPDVVSFDLTSFYYLPVTHDNASLSTNICTSKKVIVEQIPQSLDVPKTFSEVSTSSVVSLPTEPSPPRVIEKPVANYTSKYASILNMKNKPSEAKTNETQISVGFVRTSSRTRVSAPRKKNENKTGDETGSGSCNNVEQSVPPVTTRSKLRVRDDLKISSLSKEKSLCVIEDSSSKIQPVVTQMVAVENPPLPPPLPPPPPPPTSPPPLSPERQQSLGNSDSDSSTLPPKLTSQLMTSVVECAEPTSQPPVLTPQTCSASQAPVTKILCPVTEVTHVDKSSVSVSKTQFPATKTQVPVTKIQVPVTKAQNDLSKAQVSGAKTQVPVSKIQTTVTKTQTPVTKPSVSVTKPQSSVAKSQTVVAASGFTATDSQAPLLDPQTSVAELQIPRAGQQISVTQELTTTAKPKTRISKPQTPISGSPTSLTEPRASLTQSHPLAVEAQPAATGQQTSTEPQTPIFEPSIPTTKAKISVTKPQSQQVSVSTPKLPTLTPKLPTLTPKPPTLTSRPPALTPKPPTLTPQASTSSPQFATPTSQSPLSTRQPPTLTPQPPTLAPKPSLLTPTSQTPEQSPPVLQPESPATDNSCTPPTIHSDMIDSVKRRKRKPVDYSSIEKLLENDEYEYPLFRIAQQRSKHRRDDNDEYPNRRNRRKLESRTEMKSNRTPKPSKADYETPKNVDSYTSSSIFSDSDDDVPKKRRKQIVRPEPSDMNALFDRLVEEGNVNNVNFKSSKSDKYPPKTPSATNSNSATTSIMTTTTANNSFFNVEHKRSDKVASVKQIGVVNPIPRKEQPSHNNRNSYGRTEDNRTSSIYLQYYSDRNNISYSSSSRGERERRDSSRSSYQNRRIQIQPHSMQRSSSSRSSSRLSRQQQSHLRSNQERRNYRYSSSNDLDWLDDMNRSFPHLFPKEVLFSHPGLLDSK